MASTVKKSAAELVGTFVLVLLGCGAIVSVNSIGSLPVFFVFGLAFIAMAFAIGDVSGCHLNPAVSLGMLLCGRISIVDFIGYVIGQTVGAFGACGLIYYIEYAINSKTYAGASSIVVDQFGQTETTKMATPAIFVVEMVITFIFVLVFLKATRKGSCMKRSGIGIGLAYIALSIFAMPLTGASMNPVRSLAPAVFAGGTALSQLWIYIIAPLVGAVIAAVVARFVFEGEAEE